MAKLTYGQDTPCGVYVEPSTDRPQPSSTVRDLRRLAAYYVENDHDRELVQHAADMIEVLQSATGAVAWIATREGTVLHLSKVDGWNVEVVAVDNRRKQEER